jgi:hypothetical protein
MRRLICLMQVFLLVAGSFLILAGCNPKTAGEEFVEKGVLNYEIIFEIDPGQNIFLSEQNVTLTSNLVDDHKLSFYFNENLVIDDLNVVDENGNILAVTKWEKVNTHTMKYWSGKSILSVIEIQFTEEVLAGKQIVLRLKFHLPADKIQDGLASNIYELFVGSQGSHAGGPESGAFPMVTGSLEAPFIMTIKHPDNIVCAIPGEMVEREEVDGIVIESFEAINPYDPSFSCGSFNVISSDVDGIRMEIYSPSKIELSPAMLSTAGEILGFYIESFGRPSAKSYKIVFPDLNENEGGGESNGNLIFLANVQPFVNYDTNQKAKEEFAQLIAHEGYHLWNTWSIDWKGSLQEWWVEGGASYMAAWVQESLYGESMGTKSRLMYLESFSELESYRHKNSLRNLDDTWFEDYPLVYNYGALVWEQLKQKMGSTEFINALRDFYGTYRNQTVDYAEFVACLQKYTNIDVAEYLEQWVNHNAKIDLTIERVTIEQVDSNYEVQVEIKIKADRNYEINTVLGFKTSLEQDWKLIDMNFSKSGKQTIKFQNDEPPILIQIDPEYRVPQINPDDNSWETDEH